MEANKNRVTQLILLDIEKAFDSVWHKALIFKLQNIGTPPHIIKIIQSYITNRKMMVTINGTNSTIKAVKQEYRKDQSWVQHYITFTQMTYQRTATHN